jgi:hypothetical protein
LEEYHDEKWQVVCDEDGQAKELIDLHIDTSFGQAHQRAMGIHPGMEVFVPQTLYSEGMTSEQDVAAVKESGLAREA